MRRIRLALLFSCIYSLISFVATASPAASEEKVIGRSMAQQATKSGRKWSTTDHSKHKALNQTFESGAQVTAACLSCHSEAFNQFKETIHWTWLAPEDGSGKKYGKAGDSVNNFCISTNYMNDKSCLSCHPGWNGKKDTVNCLVCHGQQEYNFAEGFEDYAAFSRSEDPEERKIASDIQKDIQNAVQSVARPGRKNCGKCHFYGGGGDGVKHGDLDSSLTHPNKTLDVHMGIDSQDFPCTRCHTTVNHNVSGRIYTIPAAIDRKSLIENDLASKITCESCHTASPHKAGEKPNDHTDKVACQSCHIPTFARVNPTKMSWDWSKAGKLKDGKPFDIVGPLGKETYKSIKGEMVWEKNVKPQYFWFNGSIKTLTTKDIIDPSKPVPVSLQMGESKDPNARIFPFKIHRGKQPYDKVNNTLLGPLLSGEDGFWTTLDWESALKKGMGFMDQPFSGEYGFVESTYVYPITHMVAPKENVVKCVECHTGKNGRMANLSGFYMPARDRFKPVDIPGWALVIGSLLGVLLHGAGRLISNNGKKEGEAIHEP
jgi:octaheme c-type cytochrome (tetrathionate reductase family)